MAAAKEAAVSAIDGATTALETSPAVRHAARARLPGPIRFALVVILSFALSSLGHSYLGVWTEGGLAGVARQPQSDVETGVLIAWKLYVFCPGFSTTAPLPHDAYLFSPV